MPDGCYSGRRGAQILALLAGAFLIAACGQPTPGDDAMAKAQELQEQLAGTPLAGLDPDEIASLLGDDGGHLCAAAAGSEDDLALVAFTPVFFALRKTSVGADDVDVARAIMSVYCPEDLGVLDERVAGLTVEDPDE
ncbi:MAG: hypothetical protein ABWY62_00045 [Acidimicrobiia bacterium]